MHCRILDSQSGQGQHWKSSVLFYNFPSIDVLDILLTFISGLRGSLDKYNCTRERKHNEATLGEDIKQTLMKIGRNKTLFKCQTIFSTVAIDFP